MNVLIWWICLFSGTLCFSVLIIWLAYGYYFHITFQHIITCSKFLTQWKVAYWSFETWVAVGAWLFLLLLNCKHLLSMLHSQRHSVFSCDHIIGYHIHASSSQYLLSVHLQNDTWQVCVMPLIDQLHRTWYG